MSDEAFEGAKAPGRHGFGFNLGDGDGFDHGPRLRDCEDEDQILADLADQGYRRLDVVDSTRHELTIDARRDRMTNSWTDG